MEQYNILYGGKTFVASEYQNRIFDCVEHGVGNMIISAAAGSSKTTTIVNCTRFIPKDKKVLFIAFNRDIVEKLKEEVKNSNCRMMTFHSLGNSILIENKVIIPGKTNVNEYKYINYVKENVDNISKYGETKSLGIDRQSYINNIIKLIEYCRYYLAFSIKEIKKIADIYGIIQIRDEFTICKDVLKWGKTCIDQIDYTDMVWLPNVLNLTTKRYLSDWIFIDESQDTSVMEQEMIMKCFKRGTRFVAVGDEFQQVNIWCGASQDAINKFKELPNTVEYKLPISYRCPVKIVELAKNYSTNIVAMPGAIEGEINNDVSEYAPKENDMVLCRTTAPLIKLHLKYLRGNKKSYIRGFEEIKRDYLGLIQMTNSKMIDKNLLTSDGLFPMLYKHLFKKISDIKHSLKLTESEAISYPDILITYDNIEGIKAIAEGLTRVDELIEKINIIFNGDMNNAIQLSTIHKAKGLEADNVFIYYPSLMPYPLANKEWEQETEKNLIYVAYTRAKKTLNFIKETGNTFMKLFGSKKSLMHEFNEIKTKIAYNEQNGTKETDIPSNKNILTNTLGNKNIQPTHSKVKKGGLKFKALMD